jgi:hypothetical protein
VFQEAVDRSRCRALFPKYGADASFREDGGVIRTGELVSLRRRVQIRPALEGRRRLRCELGDQWNAIRQLDSINGSTIWTSKYLWRPIPRWTPKTGH